MKLLIQQLKQLNKAHVLNCRDGQGNQILHLAVARKQYEVIEFLLSGNEVDKDLIEVNARNEAGLTPLDILLLVNNEARDAELVEILTRCGATRARGLPSIETVACEFGHQNSRRTWTNRSRSFLRIEHEGTQWIEFFKYKQERDSPGDVRNALLVVAALIATATYQAALQPPGGIWQDDSGPSSNSLYKAGQAVLGTKNPGSYILFLIFNSVGFFASVQMIFTLTTGFPLKVELQMALLAVVFTYDTAMGTLAPNTIINYIFVGVSILLPFIIPLVGQWVRK